MIKGVYDREPGVGQLGEETVEVELLEGLLDLHFTVDLKLMSPITIIHLFPKVRLKINHLKGMYQVVGLVLVKMIKTSRWYSVGDQTRK